MYNKNRLEWHLGDNANLEPRRLLCGLVRQQARFLIRVNRLVVALAKSQDHRASCGVFAFGLPNAVRRWLGMRYPVTRAGQSGERGRIPRARWLKKVWVSAKRGHGSEEHRANFGFDHGKAVLCSNIHQRAYMNTHKGRSKKTAVDYYKGMTANEIAGLIKTKPDFMKSEEWFVLKAKTIARYGCTCMKCQKRIKNWMGINVDHIKPRKYYPHLENDPENLQILCGLCNKTKGNGDSDYRRTYGQTTSTRNT